MMKFNKAYNLKTGIICISLTIGLLLFPGLIYADNAALRVPSAFQKEVFRQRSSEALKMVLGEISPRVTIIILHYGGNNGNGERDTIELLKSLEKLDYSNYEIILVDNGSPDGFFSRYKDNLISKFPGLPKLTLIKSDINLGFAEGNNLAIERAFNEGSNYAFLLNNDTVIDKDALTRLIKVAESSEDIGLVGPKIYYYDEPTVIASAGSNFFKRPFGYKEVDRGQHNIRKEVDYICGAAMLVKKDVFNKVGGMTKELFMYGEETEWAMRIGRAGYKAVYVPEANVWHKVGRASEGRFSAHTVYYWKRNKFYIMRHYPEYIIPELIRLVLSTGNSIRGTLLNRDIKAFASIFKGIYDGLIGHFSTVERGNISVVTFNVTNSEDVSNIDARFVHKGPILIEASHAVGREVRTNQ